MNARTIPWAVALNAFLALPVRAGNFIWWEARPQSPGASVIDQGLGKQLQLGCDPDLQGGDPRCAWDVVMRLHNVEGMYGWAVDLAATHGSVAVESFQYGEPQFGKNGQFIGYLPFNYPMSAITEIGSGQNLVSNAAAITFASAPTYGFTDDYLAWSVFHFRLTKLSTHTDPGLVEIFGNTGAVEIAGESQSGFMATVAANAETNVSFYPTPYLEPVIIVRSPVGRDYVPGSEPQDGTQTTGQDGSGAEGGIVQGDEFGGPEAADGVPRAPGVGGRIGGGPEPMESLFSLCGPSMGTMLELTLIGFICSRLARRRRGR